MEWKKITIDQKELFDSFLGGKFETCDYNFTNQYLWSEGESSQYRLSDDGDVLTIMSTYVGKHYYYLPFSKTNNIDNIKKEMHKIFNEDKIDVISLVPEKWTELLKDDFICNEKRDTFDYVYNYEDLATLKGRKYSKKKNRINNFLKSYPDYTYESLNDDNIKEVIKFQDDWYASNETKDLPVLINENKGIHNLLNNFHKLDFKGGLIRVDGKIIAYTLGEATTTEYVVIHIEKALGEYIGSYQMINKLFLEKEFQGYKYVNREDDFGDEGLREAKESYHPVFMLKKSEILGPR